MYIVWNFWVCDFGLHLWHRHQASWNAAHFVGRLANRDPSRRSDVIRACRMRNTDFDSEGIGIEGGGRLCEYPVWQPGKHECLSVFGRNTGDTFFEWHSWDSFFLWPSGPSNGFGWNHKFWSFGSDFFFQLQLSSALPPHRRVSASQRLQDFIEDWLNNKHQCNNGRGYTVFQNMVI